MEDNPVSIRMMTAADGDLFVQFYAALSAETLLFFTPHDPQPEKLRELVAGMGCDKKTHGAGAQRGFRESRHFAAVCLVDGREEMCGYVFLWDLHTQVPWLGVCVRDGYKGKGIGSMLMRHVETYCRERGKGGILLTTHVDNHKAQGLYEKVGYETIGSDPRGEILMIRRLTDLKWEEDPCRSV
jgi:ribosomal protein S18 acetylase RimI-like enzyme